MKENKYVIGLDLGGTNAVFGLVDENYEQQDRSSHRSILWQRLS